MSALAALVLALVLPSVAGTVLLAGRSRLEEDAATTDVLLARGVACGMTTWLVGSGLLDRTVGISATSSWVWDAAVAAASVAVLLLPRHRATLRGVLAPAGRRLAVVGGLTAVAFAPLGYVVVRTSWSPLGSTPWYYYGLARQVAEAGSVPATSVEFGAATPFLNDYHLFSTGTAMLLVQHPGGPITVITVVTLVGVLLLGLGAVALASVLGAGRLTSLVAVPFAVGIGIGPIRLAAYRPEGFAIGLGLLMTALALDWLRRHDRRSLVTAALLAAALSQVHGVAAIMAGVMVAAGALVAVARGPRREQLVRGAVALAALVAAVLVAGILFRGASGTGTAGGLIDRGGLADPTWEFFRAARGFPPSQPKSNLSMIDDTVRQMYSWQVWWIVPAFLLGGLGLWRHRRERVARDVVLFTVLSLVGLFAIASVFMFGWQGYVPRRTGASRLVLETSLLVPPLMALGLGLLARDAWTWRGREPLPSPRRRVVALLVVFSLCAMATLVRFARYDDGQAPSREDLAVWRSLPLTADDVVLANGYTEGFIPDITPAQGLLDGRAPYTFDAVLRHANALLRDAHRFYAHPDRHWDFLRAHHVTWVVVGEAGSYALGTGNDWVTPRSLNGLESCAGLRRVPATPTLVVFRVTDPGPGGCAQPSG